MSYLRGIAERIRDTAPVSRGSVLVILEAPVSQISIILHGIRYISRCIAVQLVGPSSVVIFSSCEVGFQVDDRSLGSAVEILTLKSEIPTFLVGLGCDIIFVLF